MRQAIGFPGGLVGCEGEDGALSDEVRGGVVLIQIGEDRRKRFARMQVHRRCRGPCIHVDHEMGALCEERHLALRVATVGAMSIGFYKLAYGEPISSLFWGNRGVFAHQLLSMKVVRRAAANRYSDDATSCVQKTLPVF